MQNQLAFTAITHDNFEPAYGIFCAQRCLPWSLELFKSSCVNNPLSLQAILDSSVVGVCIASRVLEECTLEDIVVAHPYRRSGIATAMIKELIILAEQAGVHRVLLEVRQSNTKAIHLYQKIGFITDGTRPNYYTSTSGHNESAVLMSYQIK